MMKYIIPLFIIVLASSCKKPEPVKYYHEYFGMEEGRYVVYDVYYRSYDDNVTLTYQLKTVWGEQYIDNEGRAGRVFRRYTRPNENYDWTLSDTWYGGIYGIRAELVEENQRKVKLVFAPSVNKEWDVNAYNIEQEDECFYRDLHEPYSINGTDFDSTVTVDIEDISEDIIKIQKYEVYAANIGLIEMVNRDLQYPFGSTTPNKGTELTYTFVETGFE